MDQAPLLPRAAITVARQMGSGGSHIGRLLAERLGYTYVDREILSRAAQALGAAETEISNREERLQSTWGKALEAMAIGSPEGPYASLVHRPIADADLFATQAEIIRAFSALEDCVIIGRGGVHVLRDHPRAIHLFMHAPIHFRIHRILELDPALDEEGARRLIEASDREREAFFRRISGRDWLLATQYHLCVDTSLIPLEDAAEAILRACQAALRLN